MTHDNIPTTRVLLVEDDAGDRELTRLALEKNASQQYDIMVAANLQAAADQLRDATFDVLVLDLGLPESSGLETLDRVRKLDDQVPIVVLTDFCDEQAALTSLGRGAQDYLPKSNLAVDSLSRSIRYAIHRHQLRKELAHTNDLLKQKNDHLARLCDTAQQFVDNVSHEFRTPLTVIKEYVSLLRDGIVGTAPLDDEQLRFLDVVADRAADLNTMVDDMLDISKLEAGLLGAWRRNTTVAEIVNRVRPTLEPKAAVKGVELQLSLPDDLPEVYCDPEKAGRVIINLVVNAIKFCGRPGKVELWARTDTAAEQLVIGVTDNGPGIEQDKLAEIFERFRQLDRASHDSCKGFGLGLSIASELVHLNLGELSVSSEPGVGSTFSFTLPYANPLAVVQRYVSRLAVTMGDHAAVSVIECCVPEEPLTTSDDVNSFLNYVLIGNNLLFRTSPTRWLLVLPAADAELRERLDEIEEAVHEANRNRPCEPLPAITAESLGTWNVTDTELLVATLTRVLDSAEACHA
ncbi:MAG: hybrid sensor histidine kinase/response regulator [Planctomycetota bacterium]|nr:hybrid sensor histidine kinase/response regulator [Planctomycetota bacterium]